MSAQLETPVEGELIAAARNAVAEFDPFQTELAEFQKRYDGVVYDLDDEAQSKQARSDRHAIGKVVARLDRQHASVKQPLLEVTRLLDGRRKEIKDGLLEVQGRIKSQLEAHEAKEEARVNGIAERIQGIRDWAEGLEGQHAQYIDDTLGEVRAVAIDDSFDEWKGSALLAKTETVEALEKLLTDRQKYEAEQAELERLRAEKEQRERADREARIAAEAAEKAKREAEKAAEEARLEAERKVAEERGRAERERQEAVEKAERELAEANARAERAADEERRRILMEQQQADREANIQRDLEEKRKAKQQHRADIHLTVKTSLVAGRIDEATAIRVINLVKDGKVMNMEILY